MDTKEKELLAQILDKLSKSSAMNGGFDKLTNNIENIKDKQEEIGESIRHFDDALYKPIVGLFPITQGIQHELEVLNKTWKEHLTSDVENFKKINDKLSELSKNDDEQRRITNKLKDVAGGDMEKLAKVIEMVSGIQKFVLAIMMAMAGLIAKLIFDFIKK